MSFGWTTIKGWFGGGRHRVAAPRAAEGNPAVNDLPPSERRRRHLLGQIEQLERQLVEVRRSIVGEHLGADPEAIYALKQRVIRARDLRHKLLLLRAELRRHLEHVSGAEREAADAEGPIPVEVQAVVAALLATDGGRGRLAGTVVEHAARRLVEPRTEGRWKAVEELRRLRRPELLPLFKACLAFEDELLRVECLQALVDLGPARATAALEELLDAPRPRQRLAALRGLNSLGAPSAPLACLRALVDVDPELRRFAVVFLGWQKMSGAAPALAATLRDERVEVRVAAAEALGALKAEAAVFALIRALGDRELAMRAAARRALAALLGAPLEVDVEQAPRQLEPLVARLVQWWADARVDGRPWRTPVAYVADGRAAASSPIVPLFTGDARAEGRHRGTMDLAEHDAAPAGGTANEAANAAKGA